MNISHEQITKKLRVHCNPFHMNVNLFLKRSSRNQDIPSRLVAGPPRRRRDSQLAPGGTLHDSENKMMTRINSSEASGVLITQAAVFIVAELEIQ